MDVGQITLEPEIAAKHYKAYLGLKAEQRTTEDEEILTSYRELKKGHGILNARKALEVAGFHENGLPRIAFGRADWPRVECRQSRETVLFSKARDWYSRAELRVVRPDPVPWDTWHALQNPSGVSKVPVIPPAHRPGRTTSALSRYWLCWEVEDWDEVTTDPLLLRRINQHTFAIVAAWDLTEVERMVMEGR